MPTRTVAAQSPLSAPTEAAASRAASRGAVPEPRTVILDEFADYLRTVTNRDGRPYEEATSAPTSTGTSATTTRPTARAARTPSSAT